jgi:UDPglucose 6-dehydrogenase
MFRKPSSTVYSDDNVFDLSTAPTTPDGSLTFSPVLQPSRLQDALDDAAMGKYDQRKGSGSLDATLYSSGGEVKTICCVGAGYVGMSRIRKLL